MEKRLKASGAPDKTGTEVFMAIGALRGEKHSFMHDLESFFWVLFWICIYYTGPRGADRRTEYDKWNFFLNVNQLAFYKAGLIGHENDFLLQMSKDVTEYFKPLIPWINRLRKIVFPNNSIWIVEDEELYDRMRKALQAWPVLTR
jgi:hypothetical protein